MTPADIKEARLRLGLSQPRMAELLPVPLPTLRGWEQGHIKTLPPYLHRALRDLEREIRTIDAAQGPGLV